MAISFASRLDHLLCAVEPQDLRASHIGLEKETLRVSLDGSISRTDHPHALGSALTHPWITTDYAEALLEFVTPPFDDPRQTLAFLGDVHRFVYPRLRDEYLWTASMPCVLDGENSIRIADYGPSNAGRMKHVYRVGLGYRYGKTMQVIAGVHYNYSLPDGVWPVLRALEGYHGSPTDFASDYYFRLIRNLLRIGWLVPYLFGASPAVCKSFLSGVPTQLTEWDDNTYFEPYATSLRLSDIGYTNSREKKTGLNVSYAGLGEYADSLAWAINTPCPNYQAIGVRVDGQYRQLNANLLQIENEYYSSVRPKQVLDGLEKPSLALRRRGVRYVELRSLDVSPFDPFGVNEEQLRFLEAMMLFCLLQESPPISDVERRAIDTNLLDTALRGRDPRLALQRDGRPVALRDWATELLDRMEPVCEVLDRGLDETPYRHTLQRQRQAVADPDRTPSAQVLAHMQRDRLGFFHFAQQMSQQHRDRLLQQPLDKDREQAFIQEAQRSLKRQAALEAADEEDFETFLERYFAQH